MHWDPVLLESGRRARVTRVPGRMQKKVVRDQPSSGQVQQHNARFTCTLVAFAALLLRFIAVSGRLYSCSWPGDCRATGTPSGAWSSLTSRA
jgi:hypothetical protein